MGRLWCRARWNSTGFRRRFRIRSGRLRCKGRSGSTRFWRRFRRRSGRFWCRARSGSTGFQKRFRRRSGRLWWKIRSGSAGFGEGSGRLWCRARSGSTGFPKKVPEKVWKASVQSQQGSGEALGLAARFRKICKYKLLRLLGIPPKLIFDLYIHICTYI